MLVKQDGQIISELLVAGENEYPIINGIPRFISNEGYSRNFGWQWKHWRFVQFNEANQGKPMDGYTDNMFASVLGLTEIKAEGEIWLDIGCGSGRFTDVAIRHG